MADLNLEKLASRIKDVFLKDSAKADEKFDINHFRFMTASAWSGLLQKDFEVAKQLSRQDTGFTYTSPSADILLTKEVDVTGNEIILGDNVKIMSFEFDKLDNGLRSIELIGKCHEDGVVMERIPAEDEWRLKYAGASKSIFFFRTNRCTIKLANKNCDAKKAKITFIPDITAEDKNAYIPTRKALQILNVVIQVMNGSTMEKAIDMTVNGNPNGNQYTETDLTNVKK